MVLKIYYFRQGRLADLRTLNIEMSQKRNANISRDAITPLKLHVDSTFASFEINIDIHVGHVFCNL